MTTRLPTHCPNCKLRLDGGAEYCTSCGQGINVEPGLIYQREVQSAAEDIPEPTASGLVYLFAHRLVPPVRSWNRHRGVTVPCLNIEVREQPLVALLFAAAFWTLREQGHLILEMHEESAWLPLLTRRQIVVRVTGGDQAQHRGLEGVLMANLPSTGSMDAASVIYSCWREDKINPWKDVVAAVASEVSSVSEDCSKLAPLTRAFDDFEERWQRFQTSEPALYKALLDECETGILARQRCEPARKGTGGGAGELLALSLGTGLALGTGESLNDSGGNSSGFLDCFFDGVGDFFDGVGDFLSGVGDFLGSDSDFDFD